LAVESGTGEKEKSEAAASLLTGEIWQKGKEIGDRSSTDPACREKRLTGDPAKGGVEGAERLHKTASWGKPK